MSKALIATALIIVIAGLVFVVGPCAYYNFIKSPESGQPDMPDIQAATHEFYIENTGGLYLSSDYKQYGTVVGKRLFILNGFWQISGNKFKSYDGTVPLDENIFGEITVNRRK